MILLLKKLACVLLGHWSYPYSDEYRECERCGKEYKGGLFE